MDVTAHVMVRNEEYYIGPVMDAVVQAGFAEVLVADCGSQDRTWDMLLRYQWPGVRLIRYGHLTPAENGAVRQHLTDITRTPWCMMVDGDELYWPWALRAIVAAEIPPGKRYGYTTLANVQRDARGYYIASLHNKQAVFGKATRWDGAYPFENPDDVLNPTLHHYFGQNNHKWHGLHLHCLPRSPYDAITPWRDRLRRTEHETGGCLRRLRYLPAAGMLESAGAR